MSAAPRSRSRNISLRNSSQPCRPGRFLAHHPRCQRVLYNVAGRTAQRALLDTSWVLLSVEGAAGTLGTPQQRSRSAILARFRNVRRRAWPRLRRRSGLSNGQRLFATIRPMKTGIQSSSWPSSSSLAASASDRQHMTSVSPAGGSLVHQDTRTASTSSEDQNEVPLNRPRPDDPAEKLRPGGFWR
jgi:hypothetical protein